VASGSDVTPRDCFVVSSCVCCVCVCPAASRRGWAPRSCAAAVELSARALGLGRRARGGTPTADHRALTQRDC
jgi:hypothetical protein